MSTQADGQIKLVWPNMDFVLRASGSLSYEWVNPAEEENLQVRSFSALDLDEPLLQGDSVVVAGDGMDAIEALSASGYFDSDVRLVYIDPPFNTRKSFNQYGDSMATPMWLSMIRDRLLAIKPHLADNASVWLHLDDSELHYARCIMDDVFGRGAFVASVVWQKRTTRESRTVFSNNHDTILVYAPMGPRKWKKHRNLLPRDSESLVNRDNDPRGPWFDAPFTAPGYREAQQYEIVNPSGLALKPPRGRSWYATRPVYERLLADGKIFFPKDGAGAPRMKIFPDEAKGLVPFTLWQADEVGTTDTAKKHLLQLFPNGTVFDTPKPEELLERIIGIASDPGDLVLDVFAGSGTTAAVAQKMGRRWVVAERSVKTVTDFILPRLDKVVRGEDDGGITESTGWIGGGAYRIAAVAPRYGRSPNMKAFSGILKERAENKLS